ncbi:endonuclease domain-containing protein [Thermomonas sp.]|uniref:endonuclease domain-containing protein n=1 Tax=Thermomonas sp. TaxID=1971895 RepID=UPI0035B2B9C5
MDGQTNPRIRAERRPRALRNAPTDAEHLLWQHLRGRQLAGAKFRRQHPYRDYILDFACLQQKLVVELDGGQHANAIAYDDNRDECLRKAGFKVLRFWNHDVFQNIDGVLEVILRAIQSRQDPSPPQPSP